ncbi:PepSY-associated TM helix domain-containing protein [Alcanivorax sp. S71-1-4]|jgi:uncharacterized iron-regulated membrane protein|uniref:PepSY-associated TM helix domain-containing protein n=1 Tax=Alcanivorax sp. S71-1-4 TaxID=1177159 RepID=UPI0013588791|nr:PepSY-associated TM helix domain-containing protein [Alcanivorax sp. S71-1-4]KAF0805953.1 PepSY-associated TM helix domain-containing protein [Alcanivorax sp. S71-1-4]
MKPTLLALHKYAGLALAVLLGVIGASGSLLVFHDTQDQWLTPALRSTPGSSRSFDEIIAAAQAAMPDAVPRRLDVSQDQRSPHVVRFPGPDGAPGPIQVAVSPSTAQVLAVRQWGAYPMSWVYRLHYTLLSGSTGKYVVGVCGLFLLFFCLSGLYLWWPRAGRWRRAFTVRRDLGAFRFNHDLHQVAGVVLLPVMLIVAFSGTALVFPAQVTALVRAVLPVEAPQKVSLAATGEPVSFDAAIDAARRVFPEATLTRIDFPDGPGNGYRVAFRQAGEGHGTTRVWVSGAGQVLATRDARQVPAGNRFLDWQFPLHNGAQFGLAGRWLVFVSGWVLVMLCGTGVYLWWRKRRLQQQARRRR